MRDETLRELLQSPLEDKQAPGVGWVAFLGVFLLAAAIGAGGGVAGRALIGDDADPVAASTTTLPVSVAEPAEDAVRSLPVAAPGDSRLVGEWIYLSDDAVLIGVASLVEPGVDPAEAAGMSSARWLLRAAEGGRTVPFSAEQAWAAAQGMFVAEFPGSAASIPFDTLLVLPTTETVEATATWTVETEALPYTFEPEPAEIDVDGVRLVIDEVRVDDAGGSVTWHLAGGEDVRARVGATIRYEDVDAGEVRRSVVDTELPAPPLQLTIPPARPARSDTLRLYRLDDPLRPSFRSRYTGDPQLAVAVRDVEIEWSVEVFRYAAQAIEVPLAGATRFPRSEDE